MRKLLTRIAWAACLLPVACLTACYGPPGISINHNVTLTDFTYTPAGPVAVGTKLYFKAHTSVATNSARLVLRAGTSLSEIADLNDDGVGADTVAHDGEWAAKVKWVESFPQGQDVPLMVELVWNDGEPGPSLSGLPLDVE